MQGLCVCCCGVDKWFNTVPESFWWYEVTWHVLVGSHLVQSGKWLSVTASAVRPKLISQQCDNCLQGINFGGWSAEQLADEMAPQPQIDVEITGCHLNGVPATNRCGDYWMALKWRPATDRCGDYWMSLKWHPSHGQSFRGEGLLSQISSVPLFSEFFSIVKAHDRY